MNLEALLERELPRPIVGEVLPMFATVIAQQAQGRYIGRTTLSRRASQRLMAEACAHLDAGDWPAFCSLVRSSAYVKARVASVHQTLPESATPADFAAVMRRQRDLLSRVTDYARAAWLKVDADGNASLERLLPARRNASPAPLWSPLAEFLRARGVRPSKIAKLIAPLASVEVDTVRSWLTGR